MIYSEDFLIWVGQNYVRLHNVWCHKFENQTDTNNHRTTDQLYSFYKNLEKVKPPEVFTAKDMIEFAKYGKNWFTSRNVERALSDWVNRGKTNKK